MSYWTYIAGVITVTPIGETQPQKRYILDTILAHLPMVTGSERNMHVHVVQKHGTDCSSSHNEFGESMWYRRNADCDGSMRTQSEYLLVLEGNLRDRMFEETQREMNKWLNRLAKRVCVEDIMLRLDGYSAKTGEKKSLTIGNPDQYRDMFESPSWVDERGEPTWAEYMLYDRARGYGYPMMLAYKYLSDPENDAEVERRVAYMGKR